MLCYTAHAPCLFFSPCVGESRVEEAVGRHACNVAELRATLNIRLQLSLHFVLTAAFFLTPFLFYRRMSENDDIEVDSDVGCLVSYGR